MRILFITAYYPPCDFGWGYMRLCAQVAEGLQQKGHQIAVLTSTYRHGAEKTAYPVHRLLALDPDWHSKKPAMWQFFNGRLAREQKAIQSLHQLMHSFKPDIIFFWHGHGLPRLLMQTAEQLAGVKTIYYFANYLPEMPDEYIPYWQAPAGRLVQLVKKPLARIALQMLAREGKPVPLQYPHSISVSHYVRRRLSGQGLIGADARVVPNGIDLEMFTVPVNGRSTSPKVVRCLSAGRISPEKGFHTVINAWNKLRQQHLLQDVHLTIMGDGKADYYAQLQEMVAQYKLQSFITFEPPASLSGWAAALRKHDLLILASEWEEPLASILLEAMASGLLVVGTTIGGSGELLRHQETGLSFAPGDAEALAAQIAAVKQNPQIIKQLAQAGQEIVLNEYGINHTIANIETALVDLIRQKTPRRCAAPANE